MPRKKPKKPKKPKDGPVVQTIRPISDISTGSWTDEGAVDNDGSLYTSLDESSQDGDSSYVSGITNPGTFEVKLGTATDPVSSANHTVYLWGQGDPAGGGASERVDVYLYESTTLIATIIANWAPGRGGSYVQGSATLSAADANSISDYTDLRVRVVEDNIGSGEEFKITQIYMEIPDASVLTQATCRVKTDDSTGLNANSGWEAAENTDCSIKPDQEFRLHVAIGLTGGGVTDGFALYYQKNGAGGYAIVPNNATKFAAGATAVELACTVSDIYADLDATTDLISPSGNFVAGDGNEDNTSGSVTLADGEHTEMVWTLFFQKLSGSGHLADGDYVEFEARRDDGTALDAYTYRQKVTVENWPGHIGGTPAETPYRVFAVDPTDKTMYYACEYCDTGAKSGELVMMKSTNGGDAWNPVDEAGAPTTTDFEAADISQNGDTLHLIYQGAGENVIYNTFTTSSHSTTPDEWVIIDEVVENVGAVGDQGASIVYRQANSDVVVGYQDDPVSALEQVTYNIRNGSWGTQANLDTTASVSFTRPTLVEDGDGRIHFVYNDLTNTDLYVKDLSTADSLSSRTQIATDTHATREGSQSYPVAFTYSGTKYVGVLYYEATGDDLWFRHWTANGRTMQTAVEVSTREQAMNAGGSAALNAGLAVDPANDDIYAVYLDNSTMDIYYNRRDASDGTWDGETLLNAQTDVDWVRPILFTHSAGNGGAKVLGYWWDAGSGGGCGRTRYDETGLSITVSLSNAALTASGQAITQTSGAVTTSLSNAALTASGQQLTQQSGAVTLNMSAAALTAGGQVITITPGAATVSLSNASLTAAGQVVTIDAGGVISINLQNASLTASGQAVTITPGAATVSLSNAALTASGQASTITPGTVTVSLSAAALTALGQAVTQTSGAVSTSLAAALTASGQAATITPGTVTLNLSNATLTASGQAITQTSGAVTVTLSAAAVSAIGQAITQASGAVSVPMSVAAITASGQTITVSSVLTVNLSAAALTAGGQALTVTPGAVSIDLDVATVLALAQTLKVTRIFRLENRGRRMPSIKNQWDVPPKFTRVRR
jgi:hypothetical protein